VGLISKISVFRKLEEMRGQMIPIYFGTSLLQDVHIVKKVGKEQESGTLECPT
jgi:hypothetical protein